MCHVSGIQPAEMERAELEGVPLLDRDAPRCWSGVRGSRGRQPASEFSLEVRLSASGPGDRVRWRVLENQVGRWAGRETTPTQEGCRSPAAGLGAEWGRDPVRAWLGSGLTADTLGSLCRPRPPLCSALWSPSQRSSMSLFKDRGIGRAGFLLRGLMRLQLSDFLQDSQIQYSRIIILGPSFTDIWIVPTLHYKKKIHNRLSGD